MVKRKAVCPAVAQTLMPSPSTLKPLLHRLKAAATRPPPRMSRRPGSFLSRAAGLPSAPSLSPLPTRRISAAATPSG